MSPDCVAEKINGNDGAATATATSSARIKLVRSMLVGIDFTASSPDFLRARICHEIPTVALAVTAAATSTQECLFRNSCATVRGGLESQYVFQPRWVTFSVPWFRLFTMCHCYLPVYLRAIALAFLLQRFMIQNDRSFKTPRSESFVRPCCHALHRS